MLKLLSSMWKTRSVSLFITWAQHWPIRSLQHGWKPTDWNAEGRGLGCGYRWQTCLPGQTLYLLEVGPQRGFALTKGGCACHWGFVGATDVHYLWEVAQPAANRKLTKHPGIREEHFGWPLGKTGEGLCSGSVGNFHRPLNTLLISVPQRSQLCHRSSFSSIASKLHQGKSFHLLCPTGTRVGKSRCPSGCNMIQRNPMRVGGATGQLCRRAWWVIMGSCVARWLPPRPSPELGTDFRLVLTFWPSSSLALKWEVWTRSPLGLGPTQVFRNLPPLCQVRKGRDGRAWSWSVGSERQGQFYPSWRGNSRWPVQLQRPRKSLWGPHLAWTEDRGPILGPSSLHWKLRHSSPCLE